MDYNNISKVLEMIPWTSIEGKSDADIKECATALSTLTFGQYELMANPPLMEVAELRLRMGDKLSIHAVSQSVADTVMRTFVSTSPTARRPPAPVAISPIQRNSLAWSAASAAGV